MTRRRATKTRKRRTAVFMCATVAVLALVSFLVSRLSAPTPTALPPLPATAFRARIVTAAESELGYTTHPTDSYCNKFTAYWGVGTACSSGLRSEEWCADFAAWAWQRAGAVFTYSFTPGDINAASWSFFSWASDHGTWHPLGSGYTPRPGDVAVYGLDTASDTADHVAIVTGYTAGDRGPDVVNGDGDRTGFSVVEMGRDQYEADTHSHDAPLAGYASPVDPH